MSNVQGTANYVYFPDQSLGAGASGTVFLGRHKRQGFLCACKVFRSDGGPREEAAKQREFEVMKKLSHDNIVKFYAIEQESHGPSKLLIMEYCAGGSVYKMLEEPENVYGFQEEEFLIFLRDVTRALQYLSKERIVHRDIKPGNILRCIKDDLGSVYKITDFGAARKLAENDEFMSLYGTEEYLHPEIYERALLGGGNRRNAPLNATVDLWSLGVTIYHVACGRLPFQSYGGRQNKESMHRIISQKKSGYISGVQKTKDGDIEWSREIPASCALSRGLRKKLQLILSHLLENEDRLRWTFDDFFKESQKLTSHPPIHAFCVLTASLERLYITTCNTTVSHLKDDLAGLINLAAARQRLFHVIHPISSFVPTSVAVVNADRGGPFDLVESSESEATASTESLCCSGLEKTSCELPVYVLPISYSPREWQLGYYELPKPPDVVFTGSLSDDAGLARAATGYVIFIRNMAKRLIQAQRLVTECAKIVMDDMLADMQSLKACAMTVQSLLHGASQLRLAPSGSESGHDESVLKQVLRAVENVDQTSFSTFLNTCRNSLCQPEHRCVKKLKKSVMELSQIYIDFKEHKKKELSYNEQQIHKFDRSRISTWMTKAQEYYKKHCLPNTEAVLQIVAHWFSSIYLPKKEEIERSRVLLEDFVDKLSLSPARASGSLNPSTRHGSETRLVGVATCCNQTVYDDSSSVMNNINDSSHQTLRSGGSDYRTLPVANLVQAAISTADHFVQNVPYHVVMSASRSRSLISHTHLTDTDDSGIGELIVCLERNSEIIKKNKEVTERNSSVLLNLMELSGPQR